MGRMFLAAAVAVSVIGGRTDAASPNSIQQGQVLFEQDWSPRDPVAGSDGLGPLFNARSCVACHHQGGIGGGGDSRFNAQTVAIETMNIRPTGHRRVDNDVLATVLNAFHPGFVRNGVMVNTAPLAHHGGTATYRQASEKFLANIPAEFSELGGPTSAEEIRSANNGPIDFQKRVGLYDVSVRARLFQRNTTSLFGSGVIDRVPDAVIEHQARVQKRHPEISGRPSTLDDGRVGKFGWRGNVGSLLEFNDQACANEVGLETARMNQPADPTVPRYRNPGDDISDVQIRTMTSFVAALPAPVRQIPEDSDLRNEVLRGEHVFGSVGCAVCHVPNLGPAQGLYSDLLLHDMGPESFDLNPAEPYRVGVSTRKFVTGSSTNVQTERNTNTTGYYGGSSMMSSNQTSVAGVGSSSSGRERPGFLTRAGFRFIAPTMPPKGRQITLGTQTRRLKPVVKTDTQDIDREIVDRRTNKTVGRQVGETTTKRTIRRTVQETTVAYVHYEQTKFNQEWRTPPLWGVKDSAPYLHDGRAGTLLEAIAMHEGEAAGTRDRFLNLPVEDRHALVAFLETMVAPPTAPQPTVPIAIAEKH